MSFSSLFLKKSEKNTPDAREKCGKRAGILGIAFNILLAAAKMTFGAIAGAVSVLADGINNLTDCGSNVVSVIGFKVSGKPADREHPFGHRRAEGVSALVIAVVILAVAAELAVQSVESIISSEKTDFSLGLVVVLGVSVLIKLFMFAMNRSLYKEFSAETFKATATDSLSDAVATAAVLASLFISRYTGVELDGYMGAAVAIFIAFSGASILKETVSRLLGHAADAETVKKLKADICAFDGVHGVHDMTIHDYGGTLYATAHVEVDSNMPLMATHDLADKIERAIGRSAGLALTVHIDPLVLDDPSVNLLREETERVVSEIDPSFHMHDFRVVGGKGHANLVFDVAIPFDCPFSDAQVLARIEERLSLTNENIGIVATVERQNTD